MERRLPFFVNILLFLVAMGWFSRGIDFPPFYHPDEINKVIQIRKDYRNFNHPQLMLNSADLLYRLGGKPESRTETAALTRWVSVFFASATVVIMAWTAFLLAGPIAQIFCGWLLLTNPLLYELAHYLKEDPALAMGFALLDLAFLLYALRPSTGRALGVGLAMALAISAKYIGIFPAAIAVVGVFWVGRKTPRHGVWMLSLALLALAVINWQILVQLSQFQSGLNREIGIFAEKATSLINAKNLQGVTGQISFLVVLAAAIWLASPWMRRRPRSAGEIFILITTFGYAAILLFSSRSADRYLLPLAVSIPLILSVAACWLGIRVAERVKLRSSWLQAAACVPVLLIQAGGDLPGVSHLATGFQTDNRKELITYVRKELPPEAVLAEDYEVKLPDGTPRLETDRWNLPNRRVRSKPKSRLGEEFTLDELRQAGVTHVILFADGTTRDLLAGKERGKRHEVLGKFLRALKANANLVWEQTRSEPAYLHPPLQLYELIPATIFNRNSTLNRPDLSGPASWPELPPAPAPRAP